MSTYRYRRLAKQPMEVRFEFRKARVIKRTRPAGKPDAKVDYDGTLQVILTINKIAYGPYTTGIKTFRKIWDGRKSARVGEDSRMLSEEMHDYQALLDAAREELEKLEELIDGEAVLQMADMIGKRRKAYAKKRAQAGGQLVDVENGPKTLAAVYQEFMRYKYTMIEPDRRKRKDDQIAKATYETYPKRWTMISGYLAHNKRPALPVVNVSMKLTDDMKYWLVQQKKENGDPYDMDTINKAISLLKQLIGFAQRKGYIRVNVIQKFACRGATPDNPRPLTKAQLDHLETCELTPNLRWVCDSWLVAAELCLHYSDYMRLPEMDFVEKDGEWFIQNERSKQAGTSLVQTVDMTPRVQRILAARGGPHNLYYKSDTTFGKMLKRIAVQADLRDGRGKIIDLQFGQGRDSGLTHRVIDGADSLVLMNAAGWSTTKPARRYVGDPVGVMQGFAKRRKKNED